MMCFFNAAISLHPLFRRLDGVPRPLNWVTAASALAASSSKLSISFSCKAHDLCHLFQVKGVAHRWYPAPFPSFSFA